MAASQAAVERWTLWNRLWDRFERRSGVLLIGLYLLCLLVYLAAIPLPRVDGQLIGSDGIYYYAYLPSLFLDGDLDLANQYARLLPEETVGRMYPTPTGLLPNPYGLGSALLWAPFFWLGHLLASMLHAAGLPVVLDGTGVLDQAATLLGSLTYAFLGLMLVQRACLRFSSRAASTLATLLIGLATNVLYYMLAEPSMSHGCSFFATALFLYLWLAFRPVLTWQRWALLGLAGGLVAAVRLPDATLLAFPVLDALMGHISRLAARLARFFPPLRVQANQELWRAADGAPSRGLAAGLVAYGMGFLLAFAPQMAAWQVLYGSPFISGYLYTDLPTFSWLRPRLCQVFFSPLHGFYLWHPLTFVATLGLGWLYRRDHQLALWLGLGLLVQAYVIGSWRDWSQGDAFGGRMFIGTLPGLALGLAALLGWAARRRYLAFIGLGSIALAVWNGLFMLQYRLGYIPMHAPLTLQQFTVGKVTMLADLLRRLVHS